MIHVGDCPQIMRGLESGIVQTCVTSPPYFGLRDYGAAGQHGLEPTPEQYVATMVEVFREVRRLLRDDGTLWLNIGDSYASAGGQSPQSGALFKGRYRQRDNICISNRIASTEAKVKDLLGIPWMVAFALRADGWYLRQDIIWAKPNPMPESVRDRCTKAHEYLFLLSKSPRYYYDAEAIAEPLAQSSIDRLAQPTIDQQAGSDRVPGKTNGPMKAVQRKALPETQANLGAFRDAERRKPVAKYLDDDGKAIDPMLRTKEGLGGDRFQDTLAACVERGTRNKRTVWTVPTMPFREAHFATFPEALIEPCILAGSRMGDLVLDPYIGAGTTAVVATKLGRRYVGSEINPEYARIAEARVRGVQPGIALEGVAA